MHSYFQEFLYNSFTKSKEEFIPINGKNVNIYVCGLTVYDLPHLGHARLYVFFDVMIRHLRQQGYIVKYVRNITDIDDKIIAEPILKAGDASFTLYGGHTYEILEDDTLVYEYKTGPYEGQKLDKKFI